MMSKRSHSLPPGRLKVSAGRGEPRQKALCSRSVAYSLACGLYLAGGALLFWLLDARMGALPFHRVLFFAFVSLSTLGYGDLAPSGPAARLLCALFVCAGTPLLFLCFNHYKEKLGQLHARLSGREVGEQVGSCSICRSRRSAACCSCCWSTACARARCSPSSWRPG